jgi:cytochrome c oxidase subunit 3
MGILQALTAKSWVTGVGTIEDVHPVSPDNTKVALGVFLAVVTVLFSLIVAAYVVRMAYSDWRALSEPWVLWLNTAVLMLSSIAFQMAWRAADRGQARRVRVALSAAGVLSFVFLAGQVVVWQQLNAQGYYVNSNVANAFFYLLTALHALHLMGGLVVWGLTVAKVQGGDFEVTAVRLNVELCALYWHFLLLVWLVLFGLLLST